MKLTQKDAEFLAKLKQLMEDKELRIELKNVGVKYFVLQKNYGERIENFFGLTRQGVRWRFQRLFSEIYVSAYTTILWLESHFGTQLRGQAMQIAKQRIEWMREANRSIDVNKSNKRTGK